MKKDEGRKAHEQAQKELKEEKVKHLKNFIKKTLTRREALAKQKEEIAKQIKILDKDILDSKEGRLDRIQERQSADPLAKKTSVAVIEQDRPVEDRHEAGIQPVKEIHHHHTEVHHYPNRWYEPYRFVWQPQIWVEPNTIPGIPGTVFCTDNSQSLSAGNYSFNASGVENMCFTLNNSICADFTEGTYKLDNGTVKYI